MYDVVNVLTHTAEVKFPGWQQLKIDKIQRSLRALDSEELYEDSDRIGNSFGEEERGKTTKIEASSFDVSVSQSNRKVSSSQTIDECLNDNDIESSLKAKSLISGKIHITVPHLIGWMGRISFFWDSMVGSSIHHIHRDKNYLADSLSKTGLQDATGFWFLQVLSEGVSYHIQEFILPDF